MQEEGYLAHLIYPEGESGIPVGKTIAIMVEDEEDVAAFKDYKHEESDAAPAA